MSAIREAAQAAQKEHVARYKGMSTVEQISHQLDNNLYRNVAEAESDIKWLLKELRKYREMDTIHRERINHLSKKIERLEALK